MVRLEILALPFRAESSAIEDTEMDGVGAAASSVMVTVSASPSILSRIAVAAAVTAVDLAMSVGDVPPIVWSSVSVAVPVTVSAMLWSVVRAGPAPVPTVTVDVSAASAMLELLTDIDGVGLGTVRSATSASLLSVPDVGLV